MKPGELVKVNGLINTYRLVAIDEDTAWIKDASVSGTYNAGFITFVEDLREAE